MTLMGCGGSKISVNSMSAPGKGSRAQPDGAETSVSNTLPANRSDQIGQEVMDADQNDLSTQDGVTDDILSKDSDEPIDITKPLKKSQAKERIDELQVSDFVAAGIKVVNEINEMTMELEDMPSNFKKAKILRQLYYNARYIVGRKFCKKYLDELVQEGVFACIARAMTRLQAAWPNVFSQTVNPDEVFTSLATKASLSDFNPPEGIVAQVWMKLNVTALGATDLHEMSCIKAGEEGLIEYYLQEFLPAACPGTYPGLKTARDAMIQNAVASLYNCSTSSANITYFRKFDGIKKLLAIFNTPNERVNMSVLFALSYLIEEKDNHLIMANNETIDKIIDYLEHGCKMKDRRYRGFSCLELANSLERVSVNDENKKMIGSRRGLDVLMKLFNVAKTNEQRIAAANAIWMLLFEAENRDRFMDMEGAFDSVLTYKDCEDKDMRKAVTGIMWEVKMKEKHLKDRAETTQDASDNNNNDSVKHVMISYNWGQQQTMLKLRDALKEAGYNVWMDVDNIGGSTLQAMASAVENSAVILVGVSRRYKDSPNCRSEAEYAFQLRKTIVPLMLEKNYQPDGWLGFIVGAKLWIDFASQNNFRDSVTKLIREVGERGRGGDEVIKPVDEVDLGAIPNKEKTSSRKEIASWSNLEAREWIKQKCQLDQSIKETILEKLNGKKLISLHRLHAEAPEFFFNTLRADFGFCDVLDLLEFSDALKELLS